MTTAARALIHSTTTETQWQDVVIGWARVRGWRISAMRDSRDLWWGCDAGLPDLVLARRGRVVFAELKSEHGRLSKEQQAWRDALGVTGGVSCGAEWYCWRPRDEDEVRRILA